MARLIGPDESCRLVYLPDGRAAAQGLPALLYADAACTVLADVLTLAGAPIPGSAVTVGAYSKLPQVQYPNGVDTIWARVADGPPTELISRLEDRVDTLYAQVRAVAPLAAGEWRAVPGPSIANYAVPPSTERAQLLMLPPGQQLQAIACWIAATIASTNVRFGIRADNDHQAGALLLDAGTVPANGGIATLPIVFTVPAGPATGVPLWLSVTPQGVGTVTFVGCLAISESRDATTPSPAIGIRGSQHQTGVGGALPTTFVSSNNLSTAAVVAVQAA